jgi:hypothetical protein
MHFQGVLTDEIGAPLDGTNTVAFSIYATPSGGPALWSETLGVDCEDGLFSVVLGLTDPIDLNFSGEYWLGAQLAGDTEMMPRYRLTSSPYAFRAETAYHALEADSAVMADVAILANSASEADSAGVAGYASIAGHATAADSAGGVRWMDINNIPGDIADGDDVGGTGDGHSLDASDGTPTNVVYVDSDGDVGVGTTAASAKLDVRGTLNVGQDGSGHDVSFYGMSTGGKLFWDQSSMAIRAGKASGNQWVIDSTGSYSAAFGRDCKALGPQTFAAGFECEARYAGDVAMGSGAVARGPFSVSLGSHNESSGVSSFTAGSFSAAGGDRSVATGYYAYALGEESVAIGTFVTAGDTGSMVIGKGSSSGSRLVNNTPNSLAIGFGATSPILFVEGATRSVGIGNTSPEYKLDVDDTVQMNGFSMPTGAAAGHVLTSDANGIGTWQAPGAGADGDWTISGNDIYSAVSGNVGIGVTSPGKKIEVAGEASFDGMIHARDGTGIGLVDDDENLGVWVEDTGNVGIGISNPAFDLHVEGDAGFKEYIYHVGDIDTYLRWLVDWFELRAGNKTMITASAGSPSYVVVNENSHDTDFRVESDNRTYALFVNGSNGKVGIGVSDPDYDLDVYGNMGVNQLIYHNNDAGEDTYLNFTEDKLEIRAGGLNMIEFTESGTDEVVINENSVDIDTRIESDVSTHSLFVRGSDGNVGIGTSSPDQELDVSGDIRLSQNGSVEFLDGNTRVYQSTGPGPFYWKDLVLTADDDVWLSPDDDLYVVSDASSNAFAEFDDGSDLFAIYDGSGIVEENMLFSFDANDSDGPAIWGDRTLSNADITMKSNDDFIVHFEQGGATQSAAYFEIYDLDDNRVFYVYENGDLWAAGDLMADGSKPAVVDAEIHGKRKLYAMESPEVWFEDFGSAVLSGGSAVIDIDPVFATTVNLSLDYHVFLTPVGGWADLYVDSKSPSSFEVKAAGGESDVEFSYRLVAKRKGYEDVRLEEYRPVDNDPPSVRRPSAPEEPDDHAAQG